LEKKAEPLGEEKSGLAKELTFAFEKDSNFDLLALLKSTATGSITTNQLVEAQNVRRASSLGQLSTTITAGDGRRLTGFEKNQLVVSAAIKLADTEEAEDEQLEDEWEQEEFKAGDEVIIVEGENGGLFGTLQNAIGGIFGCFDPAVREDDEGNYGVDVHIRDPDTGKMTDEGFWIHPEAMQHKKYQAGEEVKVIDGINIGRFGKIQSIGDRIRMDDGAYGVDVKMDDGTIEGYWIHPTSMIYAHESEEKKAEKKKEEEDADLEEIDKFDFLPYIAFPGDAMDEALAQELNTHEIDINIRRIVANSGRVIYRFGGKRHVVRYIHGVLLVKEGKIWNELVPVLQKMAGKSE